MSFAPRLRQTPSVAESSRARLDSPRKGMPAMAQRLAESPATALDSRTRAIFEPRFGHDFSGVRVHSDAEAAASARALRANAFTVGQDIAFDVGKYQPHTKEGQKLIAHELTHTVQQKQAGAGGHLSIGEPTDHSETEADHVSAAIHDGPVSIGSRRPLSVQRQPNPAAPTNVDLPRRLDLDLAESATPFMAAAIGSVTVDGFETGKSDISGSNLASLSKTAETMLTLMKTYPGSTIRVIGHTDAVGQEADNQVLGQSRADAVQEALVKLGIPAQSMQTESHGATELLVKTKMAQPRNRRVEVRFSPGRRFQSVMSQGLNPNPTPNPAPQPGPVIDLHKVDPNILNNTCTPPRVCPGGPGSAPPGAFAPLPSDIPWELMDVQSVNEPYTSHGNRPDGGLRETWGRLYLQFYSQYHSKTLAAKAANQALGGTAGSAQSRDNPNSIDRANQDLKNAYPNSTGVGPFNLPWTGRF